MTNSAIIIVNWNCWEDTARCINACGHLTDFEGAVIVVDNGSTDDSLQKLQAWASELVVVNPTSTEQRISILEERSVAPLQFVGVFNQCTLSQKIAGEGLVDRGWYLVDAGQNRGFGAGNNIGLSAAMLDKRCALFWCLNADAIPQPEAWKALSQNCAKLATPCVSGSVLLNYDRPETIQTIGSSISWSTLLVAYQHINEPVASLKKQPETFLVGYPIGASLLLNRCFIEQCGCFDERYFLYYEEPDLVARLESPEQSFVCTRSRVYHKGGQTTGGGSSLADRGARADFEYNRSRMILARKISGITAPLAMLVAFVSILKRIIAGRFDLAKTVVAASLNGWHCAR